jgi:hypothetical protein
MTAPAERAFAPPAALPLPVTAFMSLRLPCPLSVRVLLMAAVAIPRTVAAAPGGHADSLDAAASRHFKGAVPCAAWTAFQSRRIDSISVTTEDIAAPGGILGLLRHAHVTTRSHTVRTLFGISTGVGLDTADVREGLRRLRALNLFNDIELSVASCAPAGVHLHLRTTDRWTEIVQPRYAAGPGLSLTVTERSLMGTGIAVNAGVLADEGRLAPSGSIRDPMLFNAGATGTVFATKYSDGAVLGASLAPTPWALAPDWLLWTRMSSSHRAVPRDTTLVLTPKDSAALAADTLGSSLDSTYTPVREGYRLVRSTANALVGRRVASVARNRFYLLLGFERVRADLHVAPERLTMGAQDVQRFLSGPSAGIALRTTEHTDIGWLVSPDRPLQIPRGFEFDIVLSRGHAPGSGLPLTHLDSWAGLTLAPSALGLLTLDVWSGEYRSNGVVSNGLTRANMQWIRPSPYGRWLLLFGCEDIQNPDPDIHALTTFDPIRQVVSPRGNLAESARTLLVEHDWRLPVAMWRHPVAIAAFGAMSRRRGTLTESADDPLRLQAVVLGVGARLWPASPTEGPVVLNIGYPVQRSAVGGRGAFVTLQVTPGLGAGRGRQEAVGR